MKERSNQYFRMTINSMNAKDLVCVAIGSRRVIEFMYEGRWRRAEPYAAWQDDDGNWNLHGWSLGFSKSSSRGGWRNYSLDKMYSVSVADEEFSGVRSGYDRQSHVCKQSCCCI